MADIEVGGIYRAVSVNQDAPSALVLVTAYDEATQSVSVTLLSPDVEFGSSTDLVIYGDEIGRSYDLLVESDIFGYAWATQLNRHIGSVADDVLGVLAAMRDEDVVTRAVAGPPAIERADPRWAFKVQELRRLKRITKTACTLTKEN